LARTPHTVVTLPAQVVVYLDYSAIRGEEIAWAAGLFEGEGCITEVDKRFVAALKNTDEWVVRRFHDIVERGRAYGPYASGIRFPRKRLPI
jgi:hypothetical protein